MLNTHVAIILDRSGSMLPLRNETVQSFNSQVGSIRENSKGQQVTVSLFTFSTVPDDPVFFAAPVESLKELALADYVPEGWTALNDTVMKATTQLMGLPNAEDPETAFLVIIISDGDENRSINPPDTVKARLEALQATRRWTFTYVGCSEKDLLRMRELGISVGNSRLMEASVAGTAATSALNCSAHASFFSARSAGLTCSDSLYNDAESSLNTTPSLFSVGCSMGGPVGLDPASLVGLPELEAEAKAVSVHMYTQVAKRDGVYEMIPAINDQNRVRLTIEQGKVVAADIG